MNDEARKERLFLTRWILILGLITFCMFSVVFHGRAQSGTVTGPEGYVPWFSVSGEWTAAEQLKIVPPTESLIDGQAVKVVVVGSNPGGQSEPSDPSDEVLVLAPGTSGAVPGWTGPVLVRQEGVPAHVEFAHPSGNVTRYSFFIQSRSPYGPCSKPGKPVLAP